MLRGNTRMFGRIVAVGVLGLMLEMPVFARDWDNNPPGPVGGPGAGPRWRHWRG